jgi:hypothetical protein
VAVAAGVGARAHLDGGRHAEAVDLAATLRHSARAGHGEDKRIDAILAAARRRLGAQGYDAAWSAGAGRSVDEAAERAQRLLLQAAVRPCRSLQ